MIYGKTDCSSYMLFAETLNDHINHQGIHFWSIKYIESKSGNFCYRSIGIKSIKNYKAATQPGFHFYSKDNDEHTYWYQGYPDKWQWNQTITVKLNYSNWAVTFYNGCKQIKKCNITKNITYYFVAQLCANKNFSCFKIVPTPLKIMDNINIT